MSVGDNTPTRCPYCENMSVHPREDVADNGMHGVFVTIQWCIVCEKRVTP